MVVRNPQVQLVERSWVANHCICKNSRKNDRYEQGTHYCTYYVIMSNIEVLAKILYGEVRKSPYSSWSGDKNILLRLFSC